MSDRRPLMPKATAVWLVENTALSFDQIAEFCGLHPLEVKGIADGEVAQGIKGMDPVTNGQLTREEIARAEKDSSHKLQLAESKVQLPPLPQTRKGPRYTPVSRRHDRPNAVLWLLRNHPELKDSQIMRLVGTTKPTIAQIRDRTHWNSAQLTPQDPVTLGLCSQIDLDAEVKKAAKRAERERKDGDKDHEKAGTLLPASETTAPSATAEILAPKVAEEAPEETPEQEQARVFAKLKGMTSPKAEEADEDESKEEKKEKDGE
ncbi:putative cytoplasmic protein [Hyphomicrobium denitrificans 1NES1]|uniref:Putative cytoplasmic protein n=1 Tax=Hyphomicrobium denitrificans 1NES1 TaxID=670307 RepID=N0B632_9HYPH|nr:cell cycle transcriptional regulator TrcR [Hyphomicrobium denitrificans]AGK58999.1 putative cytoplasmic protein [Hyphomicrobium denitrificans 1NES1]